MILKNLFTIFFKIFFENIFKKINKNNNFAQKSKKFDIIKKIKNIFINFRIIIV